ncbi:ABC transporter permease [Bordetella genomosp. 9]|uniref:Iron export ABC transporter permease subunit FetB n=1 Tax=Bordetella genomosp. 9 TaxID=1416803 RepID=A0A1W6Z183_9BORD|nr:iron export ABC transporter permease subunit FetB [Bordetella genomosp. 9]ARP86869.1 iron export ABC transporter permease subunit FetB [Bordetella genomosp. 9]ARP90855.1 iron export ABC transporter permease subunit FetB [Bordetella genomosp. 9]
MNVIELHTADLTIAASLVALTALVSLLLRLDMARQIIWGAVRTVIQLLLVGHLLRLVFAHNSAWTTAALVAVMMALAAREVAARPKVRLRGLGNAWVAALTVAATTAVTALFILHTALRPDPWYDARYVIALVGIVLGSVLNAASLALDGMLAGVRREKAGIEARLALGATAREAFGPLLRAAIRRGIVPSINQMSAAGIITLPGIMTGQIIAGMDPVEAVKYQILIMFLLAGASALAAMGAAFAAMRRLTDTRARLRLDRLMD